MSPTAEITVLVPVYGGAEEVERCLDSILRHAGSGPPFDLLVVDDASPDPAVVARLDAVRERTGGPPIRVERNETNLGFVATVNRGVRQCRGDVVVLNADTEVTDGWLAHLHDAARRHEGVATVTPLTNFGSICTLPRPIIERFALDGDDPLIEACAQFVATTSLGLCPEIITGVGFCLYVTREAIDLVGELDEAAFGRGYGEEVDFCLRATRLGLRHLADDRTFVYHRGATSFGQARGEGMARGSATLHERYGWFGPANTQERRKDPLGLSFTAMELGLAQRDPDRTHVLHLLHNSPEALGGSEKHLAALTAALHDEFDFSILYPIESGFMLHSSWRDTDGLSHREELLLPGGPRRITKIDDEIAAEALRMALEIVPVHAVHVQNLIGHSLAPLRVLADFDGPVTCSVRDLYLACPNHSLLYRNEVSCGIPADLATCADCLPVTVGLDAGYLEGFRHAVAASLGAVDHWVFASQSAADFFARVYTAAPETVEVIPHGAIIDLDPERRRVDETAIFDAPLRLAFVGMGRVKKGLGLVNHLAETLVGSAIEIHHFGELKGEASPSLRTHGPYENAVLPGLLRDAGIQVVLLPGPYAETFGHVMTEALIAGIPVIGAGYGALGERIRELGAGWTVDPTDATSLAELVQNLDRCREELLRATRNACAAPVVSVADGAHRYAALYRLGTPARSAS